MFSKQDTHALSLETGWVLRTGDGQVPYVVEPVTTSSTQEVYCKVAKHLKWVSWFCVGATVSKRAMSGSTFTDMIHSEMRRASLAAVLPDDAGVAALGLDDDDGDEDGGLRPASNPGSGRKRKRSSLASPESIELTVPVAKGSQKTTTIRVLTRQIKDAVWMKLDARHLEWLRGYVQSELAGGARKAPRPRAEVKKAFWCNSASCWRVRYQDEHGAAAVRNWYVSRMPKETFAARAAEVRERADAFLESLTAEGCS